VGELEGWEIDELRSQAWKPNVHLISFLDSRGLSKYTEQITGRDGTLGSAIVDVEAE
jgi:hypothetical protein